MAKAYLNSENTWNVPVLQCKECPGRQRKLERRKLLLSLVSFKGSVSEKMGRKIEDTRRSGVYGYTSCQPANVRPWPYRSWSFSNEEDWNQVQVEKNGPETLKTLKLFKKEKLRTKPGNSPRVPESINTPRRPQINTVERTLLNWNVEKELQQMISQEARNNRTELGDLLPTDPSIQFRPLPNLNITVSCQQFSWGERKVSLSSQDYWQN